MTINQTDCLYQVILILYTIPEVDRLCYFSSSDDQPHLEIIDTIAEGEDLTYCTIIYLQALGTNW